MGVHCTVLMQALASQSLELLKITTIATNEKSFIQKTGKRLEKFAQSMRIPFCFKLIMVSDMMDLKENLFELDAGETLVIYSGFAPRSLISQPDRLKNVIKVLRNLNPKIMVVTEPEFGSCFSSFVDRFMVFLFYCSAYVECHDASFGDNPNKIITESSRFAEEITNMIAMEGEDRKSRCAKLDGLRAFFGSFGMEETQLSKTSIFQANMVAENFACGSSCTLEMDGKSLLIGWKGTPLHALSAWTFT